MRIFKDISKFFDKIGKFFGNFPGILTGIFNSWWNSITRPIVTEYYKITNAIIDVYNYAKKMVIDFFMRIINPIIIGIELLIAFPRCFFWYALNIFGIILYIPVAFFFWIFSMEKFEDMLWDILYSIDSVFYQYTKYHIFHYSDDIRETCYLLGPPKVKKLNSNFMAELLEGFNFDYKFEAFSLPILLIFLMLFSFFGFSVYYLYITYLINNIKHSGQTFENKMPATEPSNSNDFKNQGNVVIKF
jgi:hypothetical protein